MRLCSSLPWKETSCPLTAQNIRRWCGWSGWMMAWKPARVTSAPRRSQCQEGGWVLPPFLLS